MKLYLISQNENRGYDTYDSAVVAAANEEEARRIHPGSDTESYDDESERWYWTGASEVRHYQNHDGDWVRFISKIQVEYVGEAKPGTTRGIICSSFNAG